ncbi:WD40 repeat-like protein [Hesseltinella vesiculosa]|uniref:WD40 repeat-like protein n=1 Tax=Hesseltinella vesiculosa TaxID=101127 RepID=A0A1X2GYA3_9FUNG|nr:WD40 repeat-like protein [Hesseltinella vesiculosa]
MGKSSKKKSGKESVFTVFDQSSPCEFFAIVSDGLDQHQQRLRLFDPTGKKIHDQDLTKDQQVLGLASGSVAAEEPASTQPKSKKARAANTLTKAVALGTSDGVLVYSLQRGSIVSTLATAQALDIVFNQQGTMAFVLSKDGALTGWDLAENMPTLEWKTDLAQPTCLSLSNDGSILAVAGLGQIQLWDITKLRNFKTFELPDTPTSLAFTPQDDCLISHDKHHVYMWNALTSNKKLKPIKTLALADSPHQDTIRSLDIVRNVHDTSVHILACTHKGEVAIWSSITDSIEKKSPLPSTWIKLVSQQQSSIRVRRAAFTKSKQPSVLLVSGSVTVPTLETVVCVDEKDKWLQTITLTRQSTETEISKQSVDQPPDDATAEKDALTANLLTALQTGEDRQVMKMLRQPSAVDQMGAVIKGLPAAFGHMLLLQILQSVESRVQQDMCLVQWLKQLVLYLNDSIKDNPGIVKRLAKLARMVGPYAEETLPRTLALQARVQMIQLQIDMRSNRAQLDEEDALAMDEDEWVSPLQNDQVLTDEDDDEALLDAVEADDMFMEEQGMDADEDMNQSVEDSDEDNEMEEASE